MERSYTVGTLRAALADLPDDLPIILAEDEEGNGFQPLWSVEPSRYSIIDGEGHPIHPDDLEDYDPEDLTDAVVLWP